MSKNVDFIQQKWTFYDTTTYILRSYDSRKTNNTSFECSSRWVQNTRRTAFLLYQGLSRNLFFKKCIFQEKGCVTAPDRATQLSLRYFETNIQGYKMRYHMFLQLKWFSLKSSLKEKCQRGGRRLMQYSVRANPSPVHIFRSEYVTH